jgi:hypothetical protein
MPPRIMSVKELEVGKSYRLISNHGINRIYLCAYSTGTRVKLVHLNTGHHISLGLTDLIDTKLYRN